MLFFFLSSSPEVGNSNMRICFPSWGIFSAKEKEEEEKEESKKVPFEVFPLTWIISCWLIGKQVIEKEDK